MTAVYPSQTTWPTPGHSLDIRSFNPGALLYLFLFTFCFILRYIIHISVFVYFYVLHSVYLSTKTHILKQWLYAQRL